MQPTSSPPQREGGRGRLAPAIGLAGRILLVLLMQGLSVALVEAVLALAARLSGAPVVGLAGTEGLLLSLAASYLVLGPLLLMLMLRWEGGPLAVWGLELKGAGLAILAGLALGTVMVLALALGLRLGGQMAWTPPGRGGVTGWSRLGVQTLYLIGFLFQGGGEELVFRSYFLRLFLQRLRVGPAVMWSGLLFALGHGLNPEAALPALVNTFLVGVLFALLTLRSGRIWLAAGAHAGWNWAIAAVVGLPLSGLPPLQHSLWYGHKSGSVLWTGGGYGPEAGLAATVVLLVVLLIVWLTWRTPAEPGINAPADPMSELDAATAARQP